MRLSEADTRGFSGLKPIMHQVHLGYLLGIHSEFKNENWLRAIEDIFHEMYRAFRIFPDRNHVSGIINQSFDIFLCS